MRQYVEETCEVICEDNGRKFVADILNFKEGQHLTIALERSVKIDLKWNRKVYEGHLGGKSFISDGPVIRNIKQGR
jgi:hypothetical protein